MIFSINLTVSRLEIGVSKKTFLKRNKLYFKLLFQGIFLNLKMSGAVSLHLLFIFLPYALFPIQTASEYLLLIVCVWKTKLNLNCKFCFAIRKFKTRLKWHDLGKSTKHICNFSDFWRTIFQLVSCWKDLVWNYIESKNVCNVKLLNKLLM